MRTLREVFEQLPVSPENGLTAEDVARSRQQFGGNRLTPQPREPLWKKFLDKFDEPIIKVLLAAALLSMVVDLFRADEKPVTGQPPGATAASEEPVPAAAPEQHNTRYIAGGILVGVIVLTLAAAYFL